MPELPEVETMCRGIAPVVGRRVVQVERPPCKRRPISIQPRFDILRRRAEGKTVAAIERFGKRVVIWLGDASNGPPGKEAIVIEPRMTGLVLLADPPTLDHLRLRVQFAPLSGGKKLAGKRSSADQLLFWDRRGLGTVRLFSAAEFAARFGPGSKTLGPDALSISAELLRERLCKSRREIKVALLDQKAVAGVGNLYASELLHLAKVHPAKRCHLLCRADWARLHQQMREVLLTAIKYEGSTLSDGTYRNALNEAGGYQNHHRVYDRANEPCSTCRRGVVRRIVQAQRSTFFCPNCQTR
jgi:formamidopyrimidine-DNA glycosylase